MLFYLRKRAIIETIFDQLKNIFQAELSRTLSRKVCKLKNNFVDTKQLILFH
jgi:hypothetical protein